MADIEHTEDEKAMAQGAMNDWINRASAVAARMQDQGLPMDVAVKRGAGPNGISINLAVTTGPHAQIALWEVLCDILEAKERMGVQRDEGGD